MPRKQLFAVDISVRGQVGEKPCHYERAVTVEGESLEERKLAAIEVAKATLGIDSDVGVNSLARPTSDSVVVGENARRKFQVLLRDSGHGGVLFRGVVEVEFSPGTSDEEIESLAIDQAAGEADLGENSDFQSQVTPLV